ncbi:pyrroloquinoline quinone biosynthesis protein PqqB [Kitasatospora azatica]|uniref:pyrroloquinoline quinone biosynthesis protein PqqB n=1 Tax=Kitasatospora azatica TaxID=58347 RepID=UPI00055A363F|nr:pyrroloquinoline quinone biosynthesis protein PqqB [Kitasatospora azatica]
MRVRILGTAAGGGLPQWNCGCAPCEQARSAGPAGWRSQEALAISVSENAWYLVNASPELRAQLLAVPELVPPAGSRDTPLRGVLLTDGELDHTVGLFALREGAALDLHAPAAVLDALTHAFPLRSLLAPYGTAHWRPLGGEQLPLDRGRLAVTAFPIGDKRPRYARESAAPGPWVVAYRFEETATGATLVYAPSLAQWPEGFDDWLTGADCVLLDGTFWTADELDRATGTSGAARGMGHLPVSGPGGTLDRLRRHPAKRRLYTHLNNTNPLTVPGSPAVAVLAEAGVEVAFDGQSMEL